MDTFIRHQGSQHKNEKTDRQTDKLCTEITEEKTEIKTATVLFIVSCKIMSAGRHAEDVGISSALMSTVAVRRRTDVGR